MPLFNNPTPGDVVVQEFSGNYLIWRVRDESSLGSKHEGIGQTDDQDWALTRAGELAGSTHAVWFWAPNARYRKIRSASRREEASNAP